MLTLGDVGRLSIDDIEKLDAAYEAHQAWQSRQTDKDRLKK